MDVITQTAKRGSQRDTVASVLIVSVASPLRHYSNGVIAESLLDMMSVSGAPKETPRLGENFQRGSRLIPPCYSGKTLDAKPSRNAETA